MRNKFIFLQVQTDLRIQEPLYKRKKELSAEIEFQK
ncbi:hypothetical protein T4C_10181 [Trichinella pseudospiralis]|uniref:Uncharacterized protein n=1 Tax=Trichinella pseudospiralis TaxID=6337 RepID=A0A0V1GG94_TRIPS|nr:hypothetical protein T4C_10181 [Trichinella pseudospiralis]